MTAREFDDETLMAFADGEADPATAREIENAIEADAALGERVAMFAETRSRARAALADQPVPERLRENVERMVAEAREREKKAASKGTVLPFRRAANDQPRTVRRWAAPLAACIAVLIAGVVGYQLGAPGSQPQTGLRIAAFDDGALPGILGSAPSGQEVDLARSDARFRAIATFRDGGGDICREFEIDSPAGAATVSVACRRQDGWSVEFAAVTAGSGEDGGYAPASSLAALDAYLAGIEAQAPMSKDEEQAVLSQAARGGID